MRDPIEKQGRPISQTQQARLVAFHDEIYALAEREAQGCMFELVGPQTLREDHDTIIATAQAALCAEGFGEAEQIAVSLLVLLEVKPLSYDQLADAFGKEMADLVEASRAIGEFGKVEDWHASLEKFARMPTNCQTLRMALLLGQLKLSPEPSALHDFWHAEAQALPNAHPILRQRVIAWLEAE